MDYDPQGSTLSWAEGAEESGEQLGFSVMVLTVKDVYRKLKGFENDYAYMVLTHRLVRLRSRALQF